MLGIFASITIKPEHRELFLSTIRETARRSVQEEAGCVRFDVFQKESDGNQYILYEVYSDERAFEAHLATAHARRAMEGSKIWGQGPFEVIRATSLYPEHEGAFETRSEAK